MYVIDIGFCEARVESLVVQVEAKLTLVTSQRTELLRLDLARWPTRQ